MKTTLLLAVATASLIAAVSTVSAGDALLSPRAQSIRTGTAVGATVDRIERSLQAGSPKGRELAFSLRKVASTEATVDLAHGPRPTLSPKDPRYEQVASELRKAQFQVAPLK